jgi:hypothetical protein
MKKIIVLMLSISIAGKLCAQEEPEATKTSKTFEMDSRLVISKYFIALSKGNKIQVEVNKVADLQKLPNMDTLLQVYLRDMKAFKDSLADELAVKRIDYLFDAATGNKVRIQIFKQKASSFLVKNGDVAALKLVQDTINILIPIQYTPPAYERNKSITTATRYCQVSFFINQATDISNYTDGSLHEKITRLKVNDIAERISPVRNERSPALAFPHDYIELHAGIAAQNYKNYFAPSFALSADVYINPDRFRYQVGLSWEPLFFFAKNTKGNLQTYRNDFVTLRLGREPVMDRWKTGGPYFNFFQHLSIGYLIGPRENFFDNHTFRLGTGAIKWNGLKLEPIFYFQDLFKNVTPGLRLSVNF